MSSRLITSPHHLSNSPVPLQRPSAGETRAGNAMEAPSPKITSPLLGSTMVRASSCSCRYTWWTMVHQHMLKIYMST